MIAGISTLRCSPRGSKAPGRGAPEPGRLPTLPGIAAEEAVQLTYTVLVGEAPAGVTEIVCQGLVCATNTPKVPSDDPDLPGPDDPTVTPLDPPMGGVAVPCWGWWGWWS